MSENDLVDLQVGADNCLRPAIMLLEDAEVLLKKEGYLSCFVLSQLALEELAKGHMLITKHLKKETFSRKEWESLTRGKAAHLNKLAIIQEVEEKWIGPDLFAAVGKQKEVAKYLYDSRYGILYVDYDFEKKQWIDPMRDQVINGMSVDAKLCFPNISRVRLHLQLLKKLLKGEIGK